MAKEETKTPFFGGFESVAGSLSKDKDTAASSVPGGGITGFDTTEDLGNVSIVETNREYDIIEPEELEGASEEGSNVTPEEEGEEGTENEGGTTSTEDTEEGAEPTEDNTQTNDDDEQTVDLGEAEEADILEFLNEKLESSLGWEFDDETRPSSVNDLVDYMKEIVDLNSTPDFANEDIAKLNDFVREGGDLRDYFSVVYGNTNYDNLDVTKEADQRAIVKANFERLGYSEDRIKRLINRYDEAGTLEEEAEDALELLKEHEKNSSETLLEKQKKDHQEAQKVQQKFFTDVKTSIEQLDSIKGVPISNSEKKELVDYIFKIEPDGTTKYQKDYAKSYNNLIESAYFTMKGDTLLSKVARKATSQAARNLQEKLAKKGKRTKNSGPQGGGNNTLDIISTVSSQLRRPR